MEEFRRNAGRTENNEIKRYYLAVVSGNVSPSRGKISFPIGTDRHVNGKMTVSKTGKTAVTNYVVEETGKNYSILRLLLETGRTHQIRVHLSYIGHPILGDTLYGSNIMEKRYLLHSHEINFIHPFTGKIINTIRNNTTGNIFRCSCKNFLLRFRNRKYNISFKR